MSKKTVLIVEDEHPIRTMIRYALEGADFLVEEAGDCNTASSMIAQKQPDLLLLDWMLPHMSGLEFVRRLKKQPATRQLPVIMLTAKADEENKVSGLECGADDYIIKPFSPRELVARINAVMRRGLLEDSEVLAVNELVLNTSDHRCMISGELIKLGPLEFRLLSFFLQHRDRVYSRDELLSRVWGENTYVDERTVDVHVRRLRKSLSKGGYDRYIQTVHGSGYRFSTKVHDY